MHKIEQTINSLRKQNIQSNIELYTDLIENSDDYNSKYKIFRLLRDNSTDTSVSLPLIFQLISKSKSNYEEKLILETLEYLKTLNTSDELEWVSKIIFVILEQFIDKKKNDEIKLLILENIRNCAFQVNIINLICDFLLNENSVEIVYAILVFIPEISDAFIKSAMAKESPVFLKNCAQVLINLSTSQKELFVDYKHFEGFMDSEHYFLRNCFLEIIYNLVEVFKESENIQEIENIVYILEERLCDVYFNVRYRSLCLLGKLFEYNYIPLKIRNRVTKSIGLRILDKAVVVRKKAISICNEILINNPFLTETKLNIKTRRNSEAQKDNTNEPEKYYEDLKEFHEVIKEILSNVMILLNSSTTQDNLIFLDFIKLCLFYEIEGSVECFISSFDTIWISNDIITCFTDVIYRLKIKKISILSFLKKFISHENNKSYEKILRELYKKNIINFVNEIINDILRNKDLYESTYILKSIGRAYESEVYYSILNHVTSILFNVNTSEELDFTLKVYSNILNLRLKTKENSDSKIIKLVIKNLSKMVFFDYQTVQDSINMIYRNSNEPEIMIRKLFGKMTENNLNFYKLIYSVGCVGINHLRYLDMLERISKERNEKINISIPEDIKERRKSINASRLSMLSFVDEEEGRKSVNVSRLSMISFLEDDEQEVKIPKNSENGFMENKSEEEISDFFFYIREKDILYNNQGLLYEFARKIPGYCLKTERSINDNEIQITSEAQDVNNELQEVAFLSLCKLMCISSEYFQEHKELFLRFFKHGNPKIRANAVVAMGDFFLLFNSLIEDNTRILFECLKDESLLVQKNALLTIYNLLKRNILRIGSNSIYLTNLLLSENDEISNITKNIIISLSKNDNFISTLVYEKFTNDTNDFPKYLEFFLPLLKEKSKEMIFLKLLRSNVEKEVLRVMYGKFGFSEKFIEDIKHLDEFKSVISVKV